MLHLYDIINATNKKEDKDMAKTYAYLRISTKNKGQEFTRQMGILKNSNTHYDELFKDEISGGKETATRPAFCQMVSKLKAGDTVVFTETSRFSRNYIDGLQTIDDLIFDKEVNIKFVSNCITLEAGKQLNPYQWQMISLFLINDEFQKRMIGFNTKNALAAKKANGKILGRKKTCTDDKKEYCLQLRKEQGLSYKEIAEQVGLSVGSVHSMLVEA